ncbi:MAG: flagellar protein FlaG [Spirochaetaceae bacterium]
MELGLSRYSEISVRRYSPVSIRRNDQQKAAAKIRSEQRATAQKRSEAALKAERELKEAQGDIDPERYLNDILRFTSLFNRKLKFSVNNDLQQVIVKVVDRETDKVIKEIPPEALQRLRERMQEVIGLLIDEEI